LQTGEAPIQCVILVGGLGTRLGALTAACPKPLLPVNGKPFLDTVLWHVARFGFERVLLLAGHQADMVVDYAGRCPHRDRLMIEVVADPSPLGTAGAIRHSADMLDATFLLLNGDSIFDFNWLDLVPLLGASSAIVTMALRRLADASRFGAADLNGDRISGFRDRGDPAGGFINGGVYLMRREIVADLPVRGSLESDVLPVLAKRGEVRGKPYSGFFLDIGVPAAYAAADSLVANHVRRPAVFFDRDGVLNRDHGSVGSRERLEWIAGAIDAVKVVNDCGWFAFLATSQAGLARGYYDEDAVRALHNHMQGELRSYGAHMDDIRYCPLHPDGSVAKYARGSSRRKPEPGMILDLLQLWPVERERSALIGDKQSDIDAAALAGIRGCLFSGGNLLDSVNSTLLKLPP
jgi:D,D-heptose 1,7-bisphosphate phosphatase